MNNKFINFLLAITFAPQFIAFSQTNSPLITPKEIFVYPKYGLGIQGGVVASSVDRFGDYQTWGSLSQFTVESSANGLIGCFFYYRPLPFFKIQLEVNYSGYGGLFRMVVPGYSKSNFASVGLSQQDNHYYWQDYYNMTFIEIPLVTRFHAFPKKKVSPFVELGASFGTLISATEQYNSFTPSGSFINPTLNESWTNVDIGYLTENYLINYILGFGVDFFQNSKVSFGLDFRLNSSFTRVFRYDLIYSYNSQNNTQTITDMVTHYHNFLIGLHTSFNIKQK